MTAALSKATVVTQISCYLPDELEVHRCVQVQVHEPWVHFNNTHCYDSPTTMLDEAHISTFTINSLTWLGCISRPYRHLFIAPTSARGVTDVLANGRIVPFVSDALSTSALGPLLVECPRPSATGTGSTKYEGRSTYSSNLVASYNDVRSKLYSVQFPRCAGPPGQQSRTLSHIGTRKDGD